MLPVGETARRNPPAAQMKNRLAKEGMRLRAAMHGIFMVVVDGKTHRVAPPARERKGNDGIDAVGEAQAEVRGGHCPQIAAGGALQEAE